MKENKSISGRDFGIDSFWLHIIAMTLMLCDHLWGTVIHGNSWLTNIGRLAFPIFAFMIVEGYFHTRSFKKYLLRMLIGALLAEIPFNLMMGGYWLDPFEQNVMWTFLIALLCIYITEELRKKNKYIGIPLGVLVFCLGAVCSILCDYKWFGVMMVAVFYFFRGNRWWNYLLQLAGMIFINFIWFRGEVLELSLFGNIIEYQQQGLAVFSMIPIMLYNGKQGLHSKPIQYSFYLFYPVHMLILSLISLYIR